MIGLVKLITGEEIVGDVKGDMSTGLLLVKNPLKIFSTPSSTGVPNFLLTRYSTFAEMNEVTFMAEHVVSVMPARQTFIDYYNTALEYQEEILLRVDTHLALAVDSPESRKIMFNAILEGMPKNLKPN